MKLLHGESLFCITSNHCHCYLTLTKYQNYIIVLAMHACMHGAFYACMYKLLLEAPCSSTTVDLAYSESFYNEVQDVNTSEATCRWS